MNRFITIFIDYNILIPIVEDFRNEKIVVKVDKTFRDSFKPLKKQKR